MKKNKGFTLVELLAVIVILAVIALIATPQILKLINDSRARAAEDSMHGYIKAVEQAYVSKAIHATTDYAGKTYTNLEKDSISTGAGEGETSLEIDLKGTEPTPDATNNKLVINADGVIECANIKFGKYYVHYNGNDAQAVEKASDLTACPAA